MTDGGLCPRKKCRATLTLSTDGHGQIVATCGLCERNKSGRCRGCPARIIQRNRSSLKMWCDACLMRRDREVARRNYHRDPDHARLIARQSYHHKSPEKRQAHLDRARRWKEKHPVVRDAWSRAYDREWSRQHYAIPENRERRNRLDRQRRNAA